MGCEGEGFTAPESPAYEPNSRRKEPVEFFDECCPASPSPATSGILEGRSPSSSSTAPCGFAVRNRGPSSRRKDPVEFFDGAEHRKGRRRPRTVRRDFGMVVPEWVRLRSISTSG